jgi:hypothetical protein
VERRDVVFEINLVVVIKKTAVCDKVKTDLELATGQKAFGKRLGQLRDRPLEGKVQKHLDALVYQDEHVTYEFDVCLSVHLCMHYAQRRKPTRCY